MTEKELIQNIEQFEKKIEQNTLIEFISTKTELETYLSINLKERK